MVSTCVRHYLNHFSDYLAELLVPLTLTLYLALLTTKALQPACHPELLCVLVTLAVAGFTSVYLQLASEPYFGLWQFLFFIICPPLYLCLTWPVEGKLFLTVLIGPPDLRPLYLMSLWDFSLTFSTLLSLSVAIFFLIKEVFGV